MFFYWNWHWLNVVEVRIHEYPFCHSEEGGQESSARTGEAIS
jgi:hypothetical protein